MRASPARTFLAVTLPGIRYGLISAIFVCFILAFTDFGVPKVVGGNYNVLATDIYKQVIGQQNFVMGATISIVLLVPDRDRLRASIASCSGARWRVSPRARCRCARGRGRTGDTLALVYCTVVAGAILAVVGDRCLCIPGGRLALQTQPDAAPL